jgi:FdhD protein
VTAESTVDVVDPLDAVDAAEAPPRPGATLRRRIWRVHLPETPEARESTGAAESTTQAPGEVQVRSREDTLAVEEPLEIRLYTADGVMHPVSITMRTPGHDFDLAAGFLFTEGIVRDPGQIVRMEYCVGPDVEQRYNVVGVRLRPGTAFDAGRLQRHFYTTSSCGVCGKTSLDALRTQLPGPAPSPAAGPVLAPAVIAALPDRLRAAQGIFDRTGGHHAAAFFTADGELAGVREDVGRHNALDKLVGAHLLARQLPAARSVLVVSGRASFELLQKAAMAGVPVMVAVGAPSSLAVELAADRGITLCGFVRGGRVNVYTEPWRIER